MNAESFQNQFKGEDARARVLEQLAQFCADNKIGYEIKGDNIRIHLPELQESLPVYHQRMRKTFDISSWGPKGVDEEAITTELAVPDELPPVNKPLDEGTTPEGDPDAEK